MSRRRLTVTSTAGAFLAASALALAQTDLPAKTGYAPVNGLALYYEIHGTDAGVPLILLHGGLGSTESAASILPALAKGRRVITVDLQAHGRTADIDRPLSYEAMAGDIAALVRYLGIEKVDVMGYSLGAGVALRTAIQYPGAVRKLVVVSTPFRRDGWYPEVVAAMAHIAAGAEPMKRSPIYKTYARIAPRPADWPLLLTKVQEMATKDYDWSKEVAALRAQTMIVFADADAVCPAHMVQFYELLGGGKKDAGWDGSGMPAARLAVLPGLTHYDIFSSPALAAAVAPFLDAPVPGAR